MQAANRDAFEHCIFCSSEDSLPAGIWPASSLARTAEQLLRAQHGVQLIITEAKVLNSTHGGFDFSVVLPCPPGSLGSTAPRRLEIEVDGQQHFTKALHGTSAQRQQAADRRKDKEAWRQGRCLLRLHHLDQTKWAAHIREAVRLATLPSPKSFLLYTRSYSKRDRVTAPKVGQAGV